MLGPATWQPSHLAGPPRAGASSSSCQKAEEKTATAPRRATPAAACLAAPSSPWTPSATPRYPLDPLDALALSLLRSLSLSLPKPSGAIAAARRCRDHRLPLASPTSLGAPPHRPRPLRQVKQAGTHRSTALSPSSTSDSRRSFSPPRALRCFPEHAEATSALAVSSSTDPPTPMSISSS